MNITIPYEVQEHIQQRMGAAAEIRLMAACRIWVERKGKWSYCNLQGGLALAFDPNIVYGGANTSMNKDESMMNSSHGCHVFYLFDMKTFDVTFRLYLYRNFHQFYKQLNPHFFYFRMPKTQSLIGFSFSNRDEAKLLDDELRFLGESEKHQHDIELLHNPALVVEQQLIENFENDRPLEPVINLDIEKDRLENAKLSKLEKDILKNAGISKSVYLSDATTRAMVVSQFINLMKEKKVQHEIKLHHSTNQPPAAQTNPEAEFQLRRKTTIASAIQSQAQQVQQHQQQSQLYNQGSTLAQQQQLQQPQSQSLLHSSIPNINNQPASHLRSPNVMKSIVTSGIHSQIPSAPPLQKLLEGDYIAPQTSQLQQMSSNIAAMNSNIVSNNNNNNNSNNAMHGNSSNIHHTPKMVVPEIQNSLLEEIRNKNYQLKPIAKNTNPVDFTKEEGINLTFLINAQIRERHKQIKKNYVEDYEESSPWDSLDEED